MRPKHVGLDHGQPKTWLDHRSWMTSWKGHVQIFYCRGRWHEGGGRVHRGGQRRERSGCRILWTLLRSSWYVGLGDDAWLRTVAFAFDWAGIDDAPRERFS
ncbi:hypothetical protein L210DRAFT_3541221 [Boletus edulis BED1]|uniref:Uncharacterized protein n=1 Tax=Boletus edulis BED1 TaxID=1328754 RepID=A0AAD4BUE6_BOLED|nr:hypothetical protein L210DRAFT_3541221 [Boletus edulis BED1]